MEFPVERDQKTWFGVITLNTIPVQVPLRLRRWALRLATYSDPRALSLIPGGMFILVSSCLPGSAGSTESELELFLSFLGFKCCPLSGTRG
jgi:hypothetical protein